jgi:mannitol 2-dehydrogenase
LCFDGISKFPVYIIPNLEKMINAGADLTRPAFLIASYRHYLKYRKDDQGNIFEIGEPWMTERDQELIGSENSQDFLELSAFQAVSLKDSEQFIELFTRFAEEIKMKECFRYYNQS